MTIDGPQRLVVLWAAGLSLALLLGPASGFFLPPAARGASRVRPQRALPTTALQLGATTAGLAGGVTASAQPEGGDAARPEWLEELAKARETKLLRLPYELRRLDWGPEEDAAIDELLVAGKQAEAQAYFEERKATSVPVYRQTLRYHWTQTETEISVGVPVPRPVRGSSMHLIVAEDALQMALIDDPSFGVISGKFAGQIDPANSGWQLAELPDGSFSVSMTLKKLSQPGTHSLWYQLFQGETLGTCLKFKGKSASKQYHWQQDLDYMNAYFPIPDGVRGKAVDLVIDAGGTGMTLKYPRADGDCEIKGDFSGVVAPDECSWVIDEDEKGERSICLSLRKRRREASESTWWPRLFREEEAVGPLEEQAAWEAGKRAAQKERDALDRELLGGALLDWIEDGTGTGAGGEA